MRQSVFKFKQFDIIQQESAMKVGTDGVLLGSWTSINKASKILDVGCGTGLITLMLAQKSIDSESDIVAIEIDEASYTEAKINVKNSNWPQRIHIENIAVQKFNPKSTFDLIVCNPPFFPLINRQTRRDIARHANKLSLEDLISHSARLLSDRGILTIIIPKLSEEYFCKKAELYQLYCNRACYVSGNKNTSIKRVMLEFSFYQNIKKEEYLVIENSRHQYTDDYIDLCKHFYLHM